MGDAELLMKIHAIHQESNGVYGSPRVHEALKKQHISIGKKRVARIMRDHNMTGRVVRVTRRCPGLKRFLSGGKNLRHTEGDAQGKDKVWVSDITFIKVGGIWKHLVAIMDVWSRKILGWSLCHTRTIEDTVSVLKRVVKKRTPEKGLIFHTDRGVEYTGHAFRNELRKHGIRPSVNRIGKCTDNAHMESFFHSLKAELIRGRSFKTMDELRLALSDYINQFYNRKRMHSGIDYMSPVEYEKRYA